MKTIIEFIKQKAKDEADSSAEWGSFGNEEQKNYRAGASNACLEILDFMERNPDSSEQRIKAAFPEMSPSDGHDFVDEIIGLLRVARSQRDDAERRSERPVYQPSDKDPSERCCIVCGHQPRIETEEDHYRVRCDNDNCLSVICRGATRQDAVSQWNSVNRIPIDRAPKQA